MKKILFVCTGNTCRSPMAAALMNKLLADSNICDIIASSAGIAALDGEPASENSVKAASEAGADLTSHKARKITREMIKQCSAVYTMTQSHAAMLKSALPEYAAKIKVLGSGIPDPYGGDINEYRNCRDSILAALKIIIEQVK